MEIIRYVHGQRLNTSIMGRVKIKHPRPKEIETRRQLLNILSPEVKVTRLIPTRDAVIVLTASDEDGEEIFQSNKREKLEKDEFNAIMPPELRAQRTVICFRLDELIYEHQAEEIRTEVERVQTWAKIQEVYKFPRSNTLKITFQTTGMAKKAKDNGILLFAMSVPPTQIRREVYTPILSCNRCHAVEEHETSQCPTPPNYVACSECGSRDHTFRECRATEKQCINCGKDHSARAMKCPIRKKALKEKEEKQNEEQEKRATTTYAQATLTPTVPTFNSDTITTGLVCVIHAHMMNAANPGSFQKTLTESLALNGIKDVKLPPNPPSADIMRAIMGQTTVTPPTTTTQAKEDVPTSQTDPHNVTDQQLNNDTAPGKRETTSTDTESDHSSQVSSDEEDATLTTVWVVKKDSDKWPKDTSSATIMKGIKEGRYKIHHNGRRSDTQRAQQWLMSTRTPLAKLCKSLKDDDFDAINHGPPRREDAQARPRRLPRNTRHI